MPKKTEGDKVMYIMPDYLLREYINPGNRDKILLLENFEVPCFLQFFTTTKTLRVVN